MTSSATHVQHGWGSWSTVAIDRLPVLGFAVDGCNTQVALMGLSTEVGVHAFIFSRNQSEIWTDENEWSRTVPVRSRSDNWPKFRKSPLFYSAARVSVVLHKSSFFARNVRNERASRPILTKQMRNSRSSGSTTPFPSVRHFVTRSVRE